MVKKKGEMCSGCPDCSPCAKKFGWVVLIIGVLYLLQDLGYLSLWGITPWAVAFVLVGTKIICKAKKCS